MANTRPAGRQEFYTIRGTNKIVRVGDTVLMKSSKNGKAPWPNVGIVMKFEYYPKGDIKNVRVRYYYRPEEVVGGRKKFHGAKELFLSGHYDVQSADIIEGTCIVYTFKNYIKLEDVRPEDFYCRFEYNVCTRAFIPDRVAVYCKCELPRNPDKLMVKCEGCRDLYHPACVEMTIEQAEQLDSYMCSDCEPKDNIRKPSSAFSNGKEFEEELERAQNLPELNVAGKSVSGKRKRYSDGCRPAQQVALDMAVKESWDIFRKDIDNAVYAHIERLKLIKKDRRNNAVNEKGKEKADEGEGEKVEEDILNDEDFSEIDNIASDLLKKTKADMVKKRKGSIPSFDLLSQQSGEERREETVYTHPM